MTEQERRDFEEWAGRWWRNLDHYDDGEYVDPRVGSAWLGYQEGRRQTSADYERLANYVGARSICPCCCEQGQCLLDCTFAADAPDAYAAMAEARDVLFGKEEVA